MAKNTNILYGKNSVYERLKIDPVSIRQIYTQQDFSDKEIEGFIKKENIEVRRVSSKELSNMKPAKDLQGIIACVDKFQYCDFGEVLEKSLKTKQTLVFLDSINDPQNLGVLIRILACFGGFALVIPEFKACEVNETVLHVASGGENYVPVSKVSNLVNALLAAKKAGYWIAGAVVDESAQNLNEASLPFPLGLVLGSEGEGIRYGVDKHLDLKLRIPMEGAELSFNVAMAGAILCYEISRQKGL